MMKLDWNTIARFGANLLVDKNSETSSFKFAF